MKNISFTNLIKIYTWNQEDLIRLCINNNNVMCVMFTTRMLGLVYECIILYDQELLL